MPSKEMPSDLMLIGDIGKNRYQQEMENRKRAKEKLDALIGELSSPQPTIQDQTNESP